MGLRYTADYRTLLWILLAAGILGAQLYNPEWVPYLFWLSCYFALACGVIAHNHNHTPTFKSKRANRIFGSVLSMFYGYPTFAWIPTHNLNHHKFVNRAGDATITWRYTNRHNAMIAASYFFVSSYFQSKLLKDYISRSRREKPAMFRQILVQYAAWIGFHVVVLSAAIYMHGIATGLYVWTLAAALPSFFALWTIMLFNYEQHVHTDPWSEHNHSRSWQGKAVNFFLFNNGLHAAHHENPGLHWSRLRKAHDELVDKIDPRLVEGSMWYYFFKQYVLAPVFPRFGSVQVGHPPYQTPEGRELDKSTAYVEIGEAGTNATMVRS